MNAVQFILTRLLPKTGLLGQFRAGDDGQYEAGWWKGTSYPNFRTRFIEKTLDGDDVVFDLATGLVWPKSGSGVGGGGGLAYTWDEAIDYCNALDFAGFTDWRLPNINELLSIVNYNETFPCSWSPPFENMVQTNYWSSTTYRGNTTRAWYMQFLTGDTAKTSKVSSYRLFAVRGGL